MVDQSLEIPSEPLHWDSLTGSVERRGVMLRRETLQGIGLGSVLSTSPKRLQAPGNDINLSVIKWLA
jgi:hypothetical protein